MRSSVEDNLENLGILLILITITVMTVLMWNLIVNVIEFLAVDSALIGFI